ncbi:calcium permeable stress-gated cation channel 1-like [Pistacia vera]|uniref:calcium permeable stress-gated cation channel 1-like n=1 Tax=Pistacia vera TaxID=55513 RepID=UPI001262BCB3|nr:calcium permeable stress-gated cation channel 1-like [Pistacia vera]
MATIADIGVSAALNILSAFIFLIAFAILRIQPFNDRVYFPKWYLKGLRESPTHGGALVRKFVNLDFRSYIRFLNWMPVALKMPEPELIEHAGLDSAVYLRIYLLGLKIFVPIALVAWTVLVPVNFTNSTLDVAAKLSNVTSSNIDKLSISNIPLESQRFWAHIVMAYAFTFWTCYVLMKEYEKVAAMRLEFVAAEKRRPDQFTVLVRNVPPDPDESVSELVEHFFLVNHPDHYLTHQVVINANKLAKLVKKKKKMQNWLEYYQNKYERNNSKRPVMKTGFLRLCGAKVDAIDHHISEIEKLSTEIAEERKRVVNDPKSIMPAAFVSFKTRWGAAVCAQTQQTRDPTMWLTEWAPEPRDVFWKNLAIPYVSLSVRRLIIGVAFFFLTFFFMIPIAFVQSLASIEGIEKAAPFLKPIVETNFIKSVIQGFLPGIVLKLFLIFLPTILMIMSKFEGFVSLSSLERRSASRYYLFNFVNVFLGSIITGSAFEQLNSFMKQSANDIPKTIGVAIPMKATFFITYIMVDGWAGIAAEILMVKPLIIYHLKNFFLVKTEKDREAAMDPGSIGFNTGEPRIQFYFLLGLVYATVTPFLLPFIIVFFALAYVVFRHQVINVYNQEYESGAAFWPDVHKRVIAALVISQLLLMGRGLWFYQCVVEAALLLCACCILEDKFKFLNWMPVALKMPEPELIEHAGLDSGVFADLLVWAHIVMAYALPFGHAMCDEGFEDVLSQPDPREDLEKLVDPRLGDNYPFDSVLKMAELDRACTKEDPQVRPSMREIVVAITTLSSETKEWNYYGLSVRGGKPCVVACAWCILEDKSREVDFVGDIDGDDRNIGVSAALNILVPSFSYSICNIEDSPFNDWLLSEWYLKGLRESPTHGGALVREVVNLDFRSYIRFLNWMPVALKMPEPELIEHAGLDSLCLGSYCDGLCLYLLDMLCVERSMKSCCYAVEFVAAEKRRPDQLQYDLSSSIN